MISYKHRHFQKEIILLVTRWYVAYSLSYRNIEEMMLERGIALDHSTANRWVIQYSEKLEKVFRKKYKLPVGKSWRMDETYVKIKGQWNYLYRAVDKSGDTIDFFLSKKRDKKAAKNLLKKAINYSGVPEKITIDKSGLNKAAIEAINQNQKEFSKKEIEIRQIKYLNNIIEQDHRAVKRVTKQMLGFKSFKSAKATIAGVELHDMLKKGQDKQANSQTIFEQFYGFAA